jgi:3-dehydroquinate dehydratase type I
MICVPVMAKTNREALGRMKKGYALADIVELRIDRIHRPDLSVLIGPREGPLLVTNRRREEGGFFGGSEEDRVDLLVEAINRGADFVDIEASTGGSLVERLASEGRRKAGAAKMIVSHHDFQRTPSWAGLLRRFKSCRSFGAHAVKIVTYANSVEDSLRLLRLIPMSLAEGQPVIAFCMGPRGRVSRLLAPLLGSLLTYASIRKGGESAPGQWTVAEMRKMMNLLGVENFSSPQWLEAGSSRTRSLAKSGEATRVYSGRLPLCMAGNRRGDS